MVPDDEKISGIQLGTFIFNLTLGVGTLTLPSVVVKEAENNAWLVTSLTGWIILIFLYFICRIGNGLGSKGLLENLKTLFGKFFGTVLAVPVCIYFFLIIMLEIRIFAETTKLYLLYNTPLEFIIYPLIIFAVFLARSGIEPVSRFNETVTPITIIIIIILFLSALPKNDYTNLMPVFPVNIRKMGAGFKTVLFAMSGFETLLVIFPFIRKPKEAFKISAFTVIIISVIYTIEIILCLAKFGTKETAAQIYPFVTLIRSSEVLTGIIERMEGLLLAMWVVFVYTTVVGFMFELSVVAGDILKHQKRRHIIPILLPFIYIGVLQGQSVVDVSEINDKILIYFGAYSYFLLPTLMFIMMLIKGRGRNKNET